MQKLSQRSQLAIGLLLMLVMAATRSHHFATPAHLPDASWAVFFVAGVYLSSAWWFAVFVVLAVVVDWFAITLGGVSNFCVTPAYAALLLAFGALWLGGRWYARRHRDRLTSLRPLIVAIVLSALGAELCSSGSFYFFGGRFVHPMLAEFLVREARYFPMMLGVMVFYVALAAMIHALFAPTGLQLHGQPGGKARGLHS